MGKNLLRNENIDMNVNEGDYLMYSHKKHPAWIDMPLNLSTTFSANI